jgi:cell division protein FtsZ
MSETGMAMMGTGVASGENRARDAAAAAVSSPLLEDINLAGANGILVNVTAGLDLAIGEFEEVGRIVKEFASEDATVVVGTVIDPEMSNEIRVTVVATGLGNRASRQLRAEPVLAVPTSQRPARIVVNNKGESDAVPNYHVYDKPVSQRRQQMAVNESPRAATAEASGEFLDIPTFLRRQAD